MKLNAIRRVALVMQCSRGALVVSKCRKNNRDHLLETLMKKEAKNLHEEDSRERAYVSVISPIGKTLVSKMNDE